MRAHTTFVWENFVMRKSFMGISVYLFAFRREPYTWNWFRTLQQMVSSERFVVSSQEEEQFRRYTAMVAQILLVLSARLKHGPKSHRLMNITITLIATSLIGTSIGSCFRETVPIWEEFGKATSKVVNDISPRS